MEINSSALIEIWKGKFFFLGRQRMSELWLFALVFGFILVIMPIEPYARNLFFQKALGIFAITIIMSFAHISNSKIGRMHFGNNAFQLYILMINLLFLAFFSFTSLFFLYSSLHFLWKLSIQISVTYLLGATLISALTATLISPHLIRRRSFEKQFIIDQKSTRILVLIISALVVTILAAAIGEIAGIVNLTKAVMYSWMLIFAVFLFGLLVYVFYEFCFIAFRKWPEIKRDGNEVVILEKRD